MKTSVDGVGRFSGDIEAAVYFCCLEASAERRQARARCPRRLRVWEEEGGLLFTVEDDGPGFDAEVARSGHGFMNMSDRLGAIGGSVRWDSTPGAGSTVRGSIPHHLERLDGEAEVGAAPVAGAGVRWAGTRWSRARPRCA